MKQNILTIPLAIIIAGVLIGGAVIYTNKNSVSGTNVQIPKKEPLDITIRPIDSSDHIVGNPDAKALIVEYSDTECPFCKIFHATLNRLVDEYGKDGNFAWVYRHFPLDVLHQKARKEAEATECAAELGGNTAFWKYINTLYETTQSNDRLDAGLLPVFAEQAGINRAAFETCLSSGRHADKVEADVQEVQNAGGRGTPYSIFLLREEPSKELREFIEFNNAEILKRQQPGSPDAMGISKDGRKIFVSGAMPYEIMKAIIDLILK